MAVWSRIALAVYLCAVAFLCFGNFSSMSEVPDYFLGIPLDKIAHFVMFLPLPVLIYLSSFKDGRPPRKPLAVLCIAIVVGIALAATTELGQSRLDYRSGESSDFKADVIAVALSALVLGVADYLQRKRHKKASV